jgi:hypothetical protein
MTPQGTPGQKPGQGGEPPHFNIQIDREHFKVEAQTLTGAELRALPPTPVPPNRDLFQVVPGGSDVKIGETDTVALKSGMRFFTAPSQINPGARARIGAVPVRAAR